MRYSRGKEVKGDIRYFNSLSRIQQEIVLGMDSENWVALYKKLWVLYKCVNMISENVGALPYSLQNASGDEVTDGISNSLQNYPNPLDTGVELIEQLTSYTLLDGNGYVFVNGVVNPEMWVLMSQFIEPLAGDKENPIRDYKSTAKNDTRIYSPDEVIHIRMFNPSDRINGMSPLQAGSPEVGFAKRLNNYKNNLYDNQGTPSGSLSTDQNLTPEQYQELIKQIRGEYAGTKNAGKLMVLEAGLKFMQMGMSPSDLDLIRSENMTESKIASLYGVPVELIGDLGEQKNYSNYREARKAFYEETVIPMAKKILAGFNRHFWSDGSKKFVINYSEISALKPTSEELNAAYWLTPNEKRSRQGLPKSEDFGMDKYYIPSSYVAIEDLAGMGDVESL